MYTDLAIILSLAVFINYVNHRFIKKQPTLIILLTSFGLSLVLLILDKLGFHNITQNASQFISRLNFREIMMNFMLGLFLFAGSLTIDISRLKKQKWDIIVLATITTILSTFIIGWTLYYLLKWIHLPLAFPYCLLFGALISPTDTIAILGFFKQYKGPKKLSLAVVGEALFNDCVGLVLFVVIYYLAFSNQPITVTLMSELFLFHTLGGIAFGLWLSWVAYLLMKPIDDYKTEILLTLALVTGGYTLAEAMRVSGPLAMVTVGIFIANNKSLLRNTRELVEGFWEIIDDLLNAILFLLIGFEVLVIPFSWWQIVAALCMIPIVLAARFLSVVIPMSFLKVWRRYPPYSIRIMTWGALRGGLAIALALAIPDGKIRDLILPITYGVVIFSILVQGSTVKFLIKRCKNAHDEWKSRKKKILPNM